MLNNFCIRALPTYKTICLLLICGFLSTVVKAQDYITIKIDSFYFDVKCDSCACDTWTYDVYNVKEKKYMNAFIMLGAKTKDETELRLKKKIGAIKTENARKNSSAGLILYDYDYGNVLGPYCDGTTKNLNNEFQLIKKVVRNPSYIKANKEERINLFNDLYEKEMKSLNINTKKYSIPKAKTDGGRRG